MSASSGVGGFGDCCAADRSSAGQRQQLAPRDVVARVDDAVAVSVGLGAGRYGAALQRSPHLVIGHAYDAVAVVVSGDRCRGEQSECVVRDVVEIDLGIAEADEPDRIDGDFAVGGIDIAIGAAGVGIPVAGVFEIPLVEMPLVVGDDALGEAALEGRVAVDGIVDADADGDASVIGLEPEADIAGGVELDISGGLGGEVCAGARVVTQGPGPCSAGDEIEQLRAVAVALMDGRDAIDRGRGGEAGGLRGVVIVPAEVAFVDLEVVEDSRPAGGAGARSTKRSAAPCR